MNKIADQWRPKLGRDLAVMPNGSQPEAGAAAQQEALPPAEVRAVIEDFLRQQRAPIDDARVMHVWRFIRDTRRSS